MQVIATFFPKVPGCDREPRLATAGLSAGAAVGISVTIFLVSFSAGALLTTLITYCCCARREKSSGQPHLTPSHSHQPAPVYDEVGAGVERECCIWSSGQITGDEAESFIWSCEALRSNVLTGVF